MTLEIDLARVAEVTGRMRRHRVDVTAIGEQLARSAERMLLQAEAAPALRVAGDVADRLALAVVALERRAELAVQADAISASPSEAPVAGELRSFAGGSVLCSVIQLASPIPSRPSTSGVTGAIDAAGVARDASTLVDAARSGPSIAGRSMPAAAVAGAFADLALCRLRVGSGAPISTRTIVNDEGKQVYEGSRSDHKYLAANGEVLDSDPERRDRQMWRIEHSNENGFLMQPYPGFPAYEVNAPRRRP